MPNHSHPRLACVSATENGEASIRRPTLLTRIVMLEVATSFDSLRVPPGNRLEALKGDRAGQHSIRINKEWRIRFVWTEAGPEDVTIEDYH